MQRTYKLNMLREFICFSVLFSLSIAKCTNGVFDASISSSDIHTIVDKHNELRLLIARGKVPGQPRGVNLKKISWDPQLAKTAQQIANRCIFEHVSVSDNRWRVGQNLYTSLSTAPDKNGANWNNAIQSWFDEYKMYRFPQFTLGTGHYTQLIWADTVLVGCGYTYYKSDDPFFRYRKLYVCNYGPAGNYIGNSPYQTGTSGCEDLC